MARIRNSPLSSATPDHDLGHYQAWRSANWLETPLDLAWTSKSGDAPPLHYQLLPHGEPSIALMRRRDRNGLVCDLDVIICGPFYKARCDTPAPLEELIAWRIKPELAAALFGVFPADYAQHSRITVPQALKDACAMTLKLGETASTAAVLTALHRDLLNYARLENANKGPEIKAAQWLRDSAGKMRLRDIAATLGVSERNLRRRFIDHVGCPQKTYARHLQITKAALSAEQSARPVWAAIAVESGFHDQAHMINAFQSEMGMTPSAFHAERRALIKADTLSAFCNTGAAE